MTVKELIKELEKIENKDRVVVMSKDGEGNSYSPLADFWEGAYEAETTYSGSAWLDKLTPEDMVGGYTEEDVRIPEDNENVIYALVLCPTN